MVSTCIGIMDSTSSGVMDSVSSDVMDSVSGNVMVSLCNYIMVSTGIGIMDSTNSGVMDSTSSGVMDSVSCDVMDSLCSYVMVRSSAYSIIMNVACNKVMLNSIHFVSYLSIVSGYISISIVLLNINNNIFDYNSYDMDSKSLDLTKHVGNIN